MKTHIMDLKDITDSREILEGKPHPFLTWFIYILVALLLVGFIWAYCSEIDEYVKATGTVRPSETISTISNSISGKVDQVLMFEGMQVKQGDLLYSIDANKLLIEKSEVTRLINKLELETGHLEKFHASIIQGENKFDPTSPIEIEYYNRVQKYLSELSLNSEQIKNALLDFEQIKVDTALSTKIINDQLNAKKLELENFEFLLRSVEAESNLFTDKNTEFYNRYENYHLHLSKLIRIFEQQKDTYTKLSRLLSSSGATEYEVNEAELRMNSALLDIDNYRQDYKIGLQDNTKQIRLTIAELTNSLEKWQHNIDSYQDRTQSIELMIEKNKLDLVVQIEDEKARNHNTLQSLYNDLKLLESTIAESMVKAPIDGTVNILMDITSGDLIPAGTEIAVIVPDNADFLMQLVISNPDIANISIGQKIKYHFHALPYREYGELQGIVHTIGADARVDNFTGRSYYLATATVDDVFLENHRGHTEQIRVGMSFDAYVIAKSKPVLRWLLEKLNFID